MGATSIWVGERNANYLEQGFVGHEKLASWEKEGVEREKENERPEGKRDIVKGSESEKGD
jgi:hypothetical protein